MHRLDDSPRKDPDTATIGVLNASLTNIPTVEIEELPFSTLTMSMVVDHVASAIHRGVGGWIVTPNLDILRRWVNNKDFRHLVSPATLFTADGAPIVWLSRILGKPIPERVAGSDLFSALCQRAAIDGFRVFFLGGNPGAAIKAKEIMERRFPGLIVAGTYCPPFGFEHKRHEEEVIRTTLQQAQPDIVFVGLGCPKQEHLIAKIQPDFQAVWWAGIGITFSFAAGEINRAPSWISAIGLEWLHRFSQEPIRLFRRYFVYGIPFFFAVALRSVVVRILGTGIPPNSRGDRKQ